MRTFKDLFNDISNTAMGLIGVEHSRNNIISTQFSRSASIYDNYGSIGATTTTNPGRVDSRQATGAQVEPNTTNKVPRIYGQVTTGGIITDIVYSNSDNTINVCLVLSEYNGDYDWRNNNWTNTTNGYWEPTGTYSNSWSLVDVYRNDSKLIFGDGTTSFKYHQVHYLESIDTAVQTDISNKIRVRMWAGSGAAADQIFPVAESTGGGSLGNAWDFMPGWTSSNTMTDLVFAIVEIDYDDPLDLKEFGTYKFTIKNAPGCYYDINAELFVQPAIALEDYLTNTRYGLGLTPSTVDSGAWDQRWVSPNTANNTDDSFRNWLLYSLENIVYKSYTAPSPQPPELPTGYDYTERHQINAILNTQLISEENIGIITQAGNGYLRFDHKQLKWSVVYNHNLSQAEIDAAFVLTDDNILGPVSIQSTDLFSMFNSVEVKFPNYLIRDESDVVIIETPAADKRPNEPFNQMSISFVGVNDRFRASVQADLDLKQSRSAQTLSLTADYSAMQLDVGDLVLVTLPMYGMNNAYFRVLRTSEIEGVDGTIVVNLLLRYTDRLLYREGWFEDTFNNIDGVNGRTDEINDGATFTLVEFVDADYASNTANYYNAAGTLINTTDWGTAEAVYINETASPRDFVGFKWSGLDANNTYNELDITAQNADHRIGVPLGYVTTKTPDGFASASTVAIDKDRLIDGGAYTFTMQFKDTDEYLYESVVVNVPSRTYNDSQVTGGALINTYGDNTYVLENLGNIVQTSAGSYNVLFERTHDIVQMPNGKARIKMVTTVAGIADAQPLNDIKFHPSAEVMFVSKTGGHMTLDVQWDNIIDFVDVGGYPTDDVFKTHTMNGEFSTNPNDYNLTDDWYPTRVTVRANGYNTIATTGAFNNTSYELYSRDALDRKINEGWYPEE